MHSFIQGFEKKANKFSAAFKGLAGKTRGAAENTIDYRKLVTKSKDPERVLDYSKIPKQKSPLAENVDSPSIDYSKMNRPAPPPPPPAARVDHQAAASNRLKQIQANSTPYSVWKKALNS